MYKATILVIDDDEQVLDILKTSLSDAGFVVDAVLEPETALKKFREQQYDAVIVDIMLPKIMGTDLLAKFKETDSNTSVILVTAHPGLDTARLAVQLSAFDYVQKPFELREIIDKTQKAVETTRSLRERQEQERTLRAQLTENIKEIEFQSQALKVEQERFYGIFKNANFGLMVLNGMDEKIILINDQCKRLLQISGVGDQNCFDKDYHHLVPTEISHQLDLLIGTLKHEQTFVKLDPKAFGKKKILEFQAYPVMADGVMIAIAIMVDDITERKQLEKQLLMASKLAGIGELAAGIAHEINNPIGFVKSNMGTLNEYVDDITKLVGMYHDLVNCVEQGQDAKGLISAIKDYEENIDSEYVIHDIEKIVSENQDGLSRVAKIVRDLRTFTRFDGEQKNRVDINKVVEESLNLTRNEVKYKATINKELSPVPEVMGFENQLSQVFINLIVNAAHAIDKRGEITVRSSVKDGAVTVEVSDTGKGMSEETMEHIFDPFFTTKPAGQGTGLGLSIAHDIVSKHGGTISIESELGKGSSFKVVLPLESKAQEVVSQ